MSRLWCHDLTPILLILILIIEKNYCGSLETSQFTYFKMIMYMIGSLDSQNSDCRSVSDLKTVTGSVIYQGLTLLAERQPRIRLAIYTALLDRLAVVNRHMKVWVGWFLRFLKFEQNTRLLVIWWVENRDRQCHKPRSRYPSRVSTTLWRVVSILSYMKLKPVQVMK